MAYMEAPIPIKKTSPFRIHNGLGHSLLVLASLDIQKGGLWLLLKIISKDFARSRHLTKKLAFFVSSSWSSFFVPGIIMREYGVLPRRSWESNSSNSWSPSFTKRPCNGVNVLHVSIHLGILPQPRLSKKKLAESLQAKKKEAYIVGWNMIPSELMGFSLSLLLDTLGRRPEDISV